MLTKKQEQFTLNLLQGMTNRDAYREAGYSTNFSLAILDTNACNLAKNNKILLRLAKLRAEAASPAIMSLQEMLEAHTEIARGRVGQFLDEGQRIKQGADLNSVAIQELETSDVRIGRGENARLAQVTKIKLHDPVRSMQEIARLMGHYPKEAQGNITYNEIKVIVVEAHPPGQAKK